METLHGWSLYSSNTYERSQFCGQTQSKITSGLNYHRCHPSPFFCREIRRHQQRSSTLQLAPGEHEIWPPETRNRAYRMVLTCLQTTISFLANVNSCSCSLYVVVRPSVCLSSITFVHPTQPIEIFGNVSAPFNTLVT